MKECDKTIELHQWVAQRGSFKRQWLVDEQGVHRTSRNRPRDQKSQDDLTEILLRKWDTALASGAVKKISRYEWELDFSKPPFSYTKEGPK